MLGPGAQTGGGGSMCGCMSRGRGRAFLLHWPGELGGDLLGDARPSRDRELQRDAAFGAVVTPFWVPAPRCPAKAGWHRAQEKRSRSSGPSVAGRALQARIRRRSRLQG